MKNKQRKLQENHTHQVLDRTKNDMSEQTYNVVPL